MTKVTIPVTLIASNTMSGLYWLTTKFIINPKGTTTKLYPIKLTAGLSDLLNR